MPYLGGWYRRQNQVHDQFSQLSQTGSSDDPGAQSNYLNPIQICESQQYHLEGFSNSGAQFNYPHPSQIGGAHQHQTETFEDTKAHFSHHYPSQIGGSACHQFVSGNPPKCNEIQQDGINEATDALQCPPGSIPYLGLRHLKHMVLGESDSFFTRRRKGIDGLMVHGTPVY
ncbi:hypothetical protein FKW77_008142 [Venturia effusa]|uniref:Uncharacterized protein n=1 Tax=Venturia effusa TaxID=50376 RepID=A0A517LKN4_9PEZI|nr:hypothetical protein FKW77_008142 [Venturia effusa]